MKKYRRIEVNAFRRRMTIVSGEWPRDISDAYPSQTDGDGSLNDSDLSEHGEPESPEGQLLLMEAMSALERRLSSEARAAIHSGQNTLAPNRPNRSGFYLRLQSFFQLICSKALWFARKEK